MKVPLKLGILFVFPLIIASPSFRNSAAFLMEALILSVTSHWTVLEHRVAKELAHYSLEFLALASDMPWLKSEFNEGRVGRPGEVTG